MVVLKENEMDEANEKQDITKEMMFNLGSCTYLLVSFDTTGSMRPCINDVRQKLRDLVEKMTQDIPGLKIALIAHGDYCDGDNCMQYLDFTDDLEKIMQFINNTPNTSGGDAPECYEYALQTGKNLSWTKEGGNFIIIGDDEPHEINDNKIEWRKEVLEMKEKNIKVFPMQCLFNATRANVNNFWEEISQIAATPLLILDSFADSANVFEAVAYAASPAAYDFYESKVSSETSKGMRATASSNMADIRSKLSTFANNLKNSPSKMEGLSKSLDETPEAWIEPPKS